MDAKHTHDHTPSGNDPVQPRSRWRWWLGVGALFLLASFLGGSAWGLFTLERWSRRPFGTAASVALRIEPGTSARAIARELYRRGLVSNDHVLLIWLKLEGHLGAIQAGAYRMQTPVAPRALIERLGHGAFERTLTIPEGWTTGQIASRLVGEGWIKSEEEWLKSVARPVAAEMLGEPMRGGAEGFCFPDTYRFDTDAGPEVILARMLTQWREQWRQSEPERRDPRSAGLTTLEVVTLASMVQREARHENEMAMIASVYLNRLERSMKLQCCATVRYALGEVWDRPLRSADLKFDSTYNTYLHLGLPPGPIANPGRPAIEAVLRPSPTDHFFYVYAGQGRHLFSRTFSEHCRATREARRAHPESFFIPPVEP